MFRRLHTGSCSASACSRSYRRMPTTMPTPLMRSARRAESTRFFSNSYGYAVFPTIGKGGVGIGGAHGKGRVYVKGAHVGDTSMTQLSPSARSSGARPSGRSSFSRTSVPSRSSPPASSSSGAQAVAITAGATAQAATGYRRRQERRRRQGPGKGGYQKGMAVFTSPRAGDESQHRRPEVQVRAQGEVKDKDKDKG